MFYWESCGAVPLQMGCFMTEKNELTDATRVSIILPGENPMAKPAEPEVAVKKLRCNRCGYKWTPFVKDPKRCPDCVSQYWNTPRKRKKYARSR